MRTVPRASSRAMKRDVTSPRASIQSYHVRRRRPPSRALWTTAVIDHVDVKLSTSSPRAHLDG